jgi:hypothetical protein
VPPASTPAVTAFAGAARRFCVFVATGAERPVRAHLEEARTHLAELVYLATLLPDGDADGPDAPTQTPTASAQGLDAHDACWEVVDPYEDSRAALGSLTDDLLDIDRDLREGLAVYDAGHPGAAAWLWRFGLEAHWGDHAVSALRALHWARKRVVPDPNERAAAPRGAAR